MFYLTSGSKGDFEVFVFRVEGEFFDFGVIDIVGKRLIYVPDAIVYVLRVSLYNHFHGAIGEVSNETS